MKREAVKRWNIQFIFNESMKISTYFIWIFMTYSVSLVQTEELPQPTVYPYSVIIQYTNNQYNFTEWRQNKQKIEWRKDEERIQSSVKNLILNMNTNVSDVDVHVWRTDCETGNSSRVENIVSDINQCSYHNDKSCITVHFKILQLDESPNWKKECDDWLEKFQEYYDRAGVSNQVFTRDVLEIVLPGVLPLVLLVFVVIFIYIKMRLTAKSTQDPSNFAGDEEEAQKRLISEDGSRDSREFLNPNMAGDDDDGDNNDGDEGQDRLSGGLNPTEESWNSRNVSTPNLGEMISKEVNIQ